MSLLDRSVREYLSEVAAPEPAATGGAVAAVTAASAAGLCAMVAGITAPRDGDVGDLHGRAERARTEATGLVVADGEAYQAVLHAQRMPADSPDRAGALRAALDAASDPPARLCRVSRDIAGIAAALATRASPALRGDAATAAELASAAAHGAATLVRINLSAAASSDAVREAAHTAEEARTHAEAARGMAGGA